MTSETHLKRFHVQHLGDASLHNQEIRIVDVHLHGAKQIDDLFILHRFTVNPVFVFAANNDESRDGDLAAFLITNWTVIFVCIVEENGHGCLRDARLTILVHQFLQGRCSHLSPNKVMFD